MMSDERENGESWILNQFPESEGLVLVRDQARIHPVMELRMRARVPFLTFPKLSACEKVEHLFSTRAGGVSAGQFRTMNFSSKLGDDRACVLENFRRIAEALPCDVQKIVSTVQTHTTNILRVSSGDAGRGIMRAADYQDVDGLITNDRGVTLSAYAADCVPIFYVDPVREAVGIAHSGWRGTVENMAGKMVSKMQEEFGSRPEDLLVGIGPSICQNCYEVDDEVADRFSKALGNTDRELSAIEQSGIYPLCGKNGCMREVVIPGEKTGKYQLDLWLANLIWLYRAGVLLEHIDVTDLCTAENSGILFSHRRTGGKRGNMGGFIRLK